MKFYSDIPNVIVMGDIKNVAHFVNGEFETSNTELIKMLKKAGYSDGKTEQGDTEGQAVEAQQTEKDEAFEEMTYSELKELAKAEGVAVGRKNKSALIEALEVNK